MSSIGKKIKYLRKGSNLTQSDLAKAIDISRVSLGNYERGDRLPDLHTVEKMSHYFDISVGFFLDKVDMSELEEYRKAGFKFIENMDKKENEPLENQEFLLTYKENDEIFHSIRGHADSFNSLFDLYNIGKSQRVRIDNNGFVIYGYNFVYYKGRKLNYDEIKQVKSLIDAILNKD